MKNTFKNLLLFGAVASAWALINSSYACPPDKPPTPNPPGEREDPVPPKKQPPAPKDDQ